MIDTGHRDAFRSLGFHVEELLGRGGSGAVYRARQIDLDGREVALKVFDRVDADLMRTLEREIVAARGLRHHNLVTIYGGSTSGDLPHLVLELAEPTSQHTRLELRPLLACGVKLASVLQLAHRCGVIHSDVKPPNILWHQGREPLLGDFGSAVIEAETRMRIQAGYTPTWAPAWLSHRTADPTTDVWSLAASLIWLHWGWQPRQIHWNHLPPDLQRAFGLAMPTRPDHHPLGPEPALAFGQLLQRAQHDRGHEITSFPESSQPNWSPSVQVQATASSTGPRAVAGSAGTRPDPAAVPVEPAPTGSVPVIVGAETPESLATTQLADRGRRHRAVSVVAGSLLAATAGLAVTVVPDLLGLGSDDASSQTPGGIGTDPSAFGPTRSTRTRPLLFAAGSGSDPDLYRLDVDGASVPLQTGAGSDVHPTLAPTGDRYAFESNRDGVRGVYLAPVDGSAEPLLLSPSGVESVEPAWDPTGDRLAWATRGTTSWDIVVHDLGSGTATTVVDDAADDREPAWSPDGDALVFRSDRTGAGDLYTVSLASRSMARITGSPLPEGHPAWGADGVIAYEVQRNDDTDVYTIDAGGEPVRRTVRSGFDGFPTFDGDLLLVVRRDGSRSAVVADPGGDDEEVLYEVEGSVRDLTAW